MSKTSLTLYLYKQMKIKSVNPSCCYWDHLPSTHPLLGRHSNTRSKAKVICPWNRGLLWQGSGKGERPPGVLPVCIMDLSEVKDSIIISHPVTLPPSRSHYCTFIGVYTTRIIYHFRPSSNAKGGYCRSKPSISELYCSTRNVRPKIHIFTV